MRESRSAAAVMAVVLVVTGCATFRDRQWGTCAVAGAVIGGAVGGITGGAAVNNGKHDPSNEERGAGIGGGLAAGALLGGLLGHAICDPEKVPPPPPVAQAAPPPPPPPPPPKGTKLATLGAANFDFNKATVKPEGRNILDETVKTLKDNPDTKVVVEGHTDSVGSDAYNKKLSQRRAATVRDYLVRAGIDASRVRAEGFGKSRPIADNGTAEGRAKNRRADVVVE